MFLDFSARFPGSTWEPEEKPAHATIIKRSIMEATRMNLFGVISTAVLSLTLVAAAPVFAQEQHEDEQKAKPAQEEKKAQPEKSAKQEEKPAQQEKSTKQEEKNAQQQEKNNKNEEKNAQQQKNTKQEEKSAQQQEKNTRNEEKNTQPAQRAGGNGGGRIPEARFQAHFGREHTFRVSQSDYSNHRFQYGGYWFGFADPWPSNWLYTQNVFVVDINGVYYLCNATYPGVNVALSFTL